jgi:chromate transporter
MMNETAAPPAPSFGEALRFWSKLGWISFGGPAGQIAIMHKELVEKRRWLSEDHFLHALNFCMLLPGPEAQQLATYLGWRLHGARGGIAAGVLFVLPSAFILLGLSWLYMAGGEVRWIQGIFHGLIPAVIAIVVAAVTRIGSKALKTPALRVLALLAFVAIFFFKAPFVAILLAAAAIGFMGGKRFPRQFPAARGHGGAETDGLPRVVLPPAARASGPRTAGVTVLCLALWWLPVLACGLLGGWQGIHFQQGLFFSKAALVTFGGAYAVLPYVAQMAVEHHGWLGQRQMMAGLGLAESTPGPLIMVLQFVGFVAAWQNPGGLPPLLAATLGAAITTWVTFLPCFLFVFLGAPHVEGLRERPALSATLGAITAAVVGVILNLAIWFGWHAVRPVAGTIDGFVVVVAIGAWLAMERFKVGVIPTLAACALLGIAWAMMVPAVGWAPRDRRG